MTRAWAVVERVDGPDGCLELRRRGERDYLIALDGRVLMNAAASRSEQELGRIAAEAIAGETAPRMLIAGLGMGFTLRAALDALPSDAQVEVAEVEPAVVAWCRGPIADLNGRALADPRVELQVVDVAERIRASEAAFDAVALDLYEGVRLPGPGEPDPHYGPQALRSLRRSLREGGVFARWCEQPDPAFERRLTRAGFAFERRRAGGRGGRRHCVYLARSNSREARAAVADR